MGGVHGCVRCVGAGAPGPRSRYNLTVVGSRAKKGQKSYLTQLLYMTAMLTSTCSGCLGGGCPGNASATDALGEGGCPCAHALIRYLTLI